jgi:transcriptional antiterminator NusG
MVHETPNPEPDPAGPENPVAVPQPDSTADGLAADTHRTPPAGEEPAPEAEAKDQPAEEPEPEPDAVAEETPAEAAAAEEEEPEGAAEAEPEPEPVVNNKSWYVVKVQSGREESIKEAIERRMKIEGLEEYFGQIIIPIERSVEMKNQKRVVRERKLYPGYLMVEVEYNDQMLYLFRETSGVGDFVGGGPNHSPQPMPAHEVERMLHSQKPGTQTTSKLPPPKPKFDRGDRVQVKDGVFAGMEGEVKDVLEAKGMVRVELTVLGRPVAVELEYWQVESA